MTRGDSLLGRGETRWLAGILVVALVLRVAWVVAVQPDPRDGRLDDAWAHDAIARALADGRGYVSPTAHLPTASVPPGYPAVLSAAYLLPGDDVAAGRALNVALGLAVVAGVYYLASRLWSARAGLVAAGIMAFFPSHVFAASVLLKEPLYAAAVVGLLCLTLAWTVRGRPSTRRLIILGMAAAFAALVRPEAFAVVVVVVLAWLYVHRSWRRAAAYAGLLVAGMALLLVPWTVRNWVEVGSPVVVSTGGGVVLAEAHNPDAGGRPPLDLSRSQGVLYGLRFAGVAAPEREVRIDRAAYGDSFRYAVRHIPRELGLVPHRLAWFFRGDRDILFFVQDAPADRPRELSATAEGLWGGVADAYYYGVAGLMVLGLPWWARRLRREHVLLWGPVAGYALMWAFLFAGLARYHFPLLPIFAVLAAMGIAAASERLWPPRAPEAPSSVGRRRVNG